MSDLHGWQRLMVQREARASGALDGETQHVAAADGSCCWEHAMAKIAELEAEVKRLTAWLRECDVAIGGDGSDESLLGLVYTCGAAKDALAEVERLRERVRELGAEVYRLTIARRPEVALVEPSKWVKG